MYTSHLEIAKLFKHDPVTDEYFYYLETSTNTHRETNRGGEWVTISKDVYDFLRQSAWAEYKREERSLRCRLENGSRCMKSCKECMHSRNGAPLSFEHLKDTGYLFKDSYDMETYIEISEMLKALRDILHELPDQRRNIIYLYAAGLSERKIGKILGLKQKYVNYWKNKDLAVLKERLKDFCQ